MELLKVSSKSNPGAVAGAIAGSIRTSGSTEVQALGAGAVNIAVKSIAIASSFLTPEGISIFCVPSFAAVSTEDGRELTAISFKIESRKD